MRYGELAAVYPGLLTSFKASSFKPQASSLHHCHPPTRRRAQWHCAYTITSPSSHIPHLPTASHAVRTLFFLDSCRVLLYIARSIIHIIYILVGYKGLWPPSRLSNIDRSAMLNAIGKPRASCSHPGYRARSNFTVISSRLIRLVYIEYNATSYIRYTPYRFVGYPQYTVHANISSIYGER